MQWSCLGSAVPHQSTYKSGLVIKLYNQRPFLFLFPASIFPFSPAARLFSSSPSCQVRQHALEKCELSGAMGRDEERKTKLRLWEWGMDSSRAAGLEPQFRKLKMVRGCFFFVFLTTCMQNSPKINFLWKKSFNLTSTRSVWWNRKRPWWEELFLLELFVCHSVSLSDSPSWWTSVVL